MTTGATAPTRAADLPASPPPPRSEAGGTAPVRVHKVSKVFGDATNAVHALDKISLTVEPGEFVCILGASGCGKSTLLNLVAGLDRPSAGTIDVEGRTRLMFQEAALFPWLTARANIELALRLDGLGRAERRTRSDELLAMVNLGEFAKKRPHELSGGMRQRVALARALAQRRRRAPDGRAVRRTRCDDARRAPRRDRAGLA